MKTKIKLLKSFSYVLVLCLVIILPSCEGPEGPEGPIGPTGATGSAGANGTNGTNGTSGTNGTNGTNGQNFSNYLEPFNSPYTFAAPITTTSSAPGVSDWFATTNLHFGSSSSLFNDGKVQSGAIENDEYSSMSIAVNMPHSGLCQFEVSISSEYGYDYLNWYVDETKINGISGIGGPFTFYFILPSGQHTIKFEYEKDEIFIDGLDAVRIDNILITNFAVGGRPSLPPQPELPSSVSLWSERPTGLRK